MTSKQQDDMARALARAYSAGLDIVGQGRMRNGNRFFVIPSATEPARMHVVTSDGSRLHCDCTGGQFDHICQHRALAHEYLSHEAAKRAAQAEEVKLALAESEAEQALHEAARVLETAIDAPARRGQRNGPKVRDDVKAFSIYR